jgi:hypothetical protein
VDYSFRGRRSRWLGTREAFSDPFSFVVEVPAAGYVWEDATDAPGSGPVLRVAPGGRWPAEEVHPLSLPDLHRRFARVPPTLDGIVVFARRFGPLSVEGWPEHEPDALPVWRDRIYRMRGLLALWEWVRRKDDKSLRSVIRVAPPPPDRRHPVVTGVYSFAMAWSSRGAEPDMAWQAFDSPEYRQATSQTSDPMVWFVGTSDMLRNSKDPFADPDMLYVRPLDDWRDGDLVTPARDFLDALVSRTLRGHAHVAVSRAHPGGVAIRPDCLWSAMVALLALEMGGRSRPIARCANPACSQLFTPDHGRQAYCEGRCRKQAYENRRSKTRD